VNNLLTVIFLMLVPAAQDRADRQYIMARSSHVWMVCDIVRLPPRTMYYNDESYKVYRQYWVTWYCTTDGRWRFYISDFNNPIYHESMVGIWDRNAPVRVSVVEDKQ
jgi:hypothetical protein